MQREMLRACAVRDRSLVHERRRALYGAGARGARRVPVAALRAGCGRPVYRVYLYKHCIHVIRRAARESLKAGRPGERARVEEGETLRARPLLCLCSLLFGASARDPRSLTRRPGVNKSYAAPRVGAH